MAHLTRAPWPPPPIITPRLMLREPEPRDRSALIDLFACAEVGAYIAGVQPRDELEQRLPDDNRRPGLFAIDLDGTMIGIVTLGRPGSVDGLTDAERELLMNVRALRLEVVVFGAGDPGVDRPGGRHADVALGLPV